LADGPQAYDYLIVCRSCTRTPAEVDGRSVAPGEGLIDIEKVHQVMLAAISVANVRERANKQKEAA
jgi:hypothetical protein